MNKDEELLIEAVLDDDLKEVQKLLQAGVNPNILDEYENSCIYYAILHKNLNIVTALLDYGANPNTIDGKGNDVLSLAIKKRKPEIINSLLEKGADPSKVLNNLLERKGDIKINLISLLIEKDKAFNLRNSTGETFLHLAAQQGKIQMFDKYLDYLQTVNINDKAGYTPLYWSKLLDHTEISNMLSKRAEELKETAYTKITKTQFFEKLPPIPKIAVSYNAEVGGTTSEATKDKLKYQYCNVEDINYRKIIPESANIEKNLNESLINQAKQKAKELLTDKDALVIPGNNLAVDSKAANYFGGEVNLKDNRSDFARSLAEMIMVEVAIEKGMPIMGICGGHQIVNTYLKGKIADISNHSHDSIIIEPTSELASIIKTNSMQKEVLAQDFFGSHNNTVEEVGGKNRLINKKDLLKVTATNEHREIEATESQFGAPIRTFQFHPEISEDNNLIAEVIRDKKIFASFVQSAETFMNKKSLGADIKFKVPVKKSFTEMVLNRKEQQNNQRGI
ncbi:MAG TPA: ankyrin repeat domain-containing protein [Rickettsia endosymbiont of Bembidion nr. Transversale]|nr:ankyrin repeat domain-containing protein [Rickettsia endosymbiont of Bembidion nr. Transversale]